MRDQGLERRRYHETRWSETPVYMMEENTPTYVRQ
jgi:hypothetical protein